MVNPVSNVRFCANVATPNVNPLEREGAFARPKTEVTPEATKKSSGGKKFLKFLAGAAVAAIALATLNKTGAVKVLETLDGATMMQKVGHYVAKAGEYVLKYTWEPLSKLFAKKTA